MNESNMQDNMVCDVSRGRQGRGRRSLAGLVVILLICAGLRVWMAVQSETISNDGVYYIKIAQSLLQDPIKTLRGSWVHPAYPAFMAGANAILDWLGLVSDKMIRWELAGISVSLLMSLIATVAVWLLAGLAFDGRVAWVTALLFSVGRKWAALGADVLTDTTAVCVMLWIAAVAILTLRRMRAGKSAVGLGAITGLCAGLGYLVRPEAGVVFLAAFVLWGMWGMRALRSVVRFKPVLVTALAAGAAAMVIVAPYVIAIGGITPKINMLRDNVGNVIGSYASNPVLLGAICPWADSFYHSFPLVVLRNFVEAQHPLLAGATFVYVGVVIAAVVFRAKRLGALIRFPSSDYASMVAVVALLWIPLLIVRSGMEGGISHRYLMLPAAVAAPFAGALLVGLVGWICSQVGKLTNSIRRTKYIPAAVIMILAAMMILHASKPLHANRGCYKAAGVFLRGLIGENERIWTDKPLVSYYARAKGLRIRSAVTGNYIKPIDTLLFRHRSRSRIQYLALTDKTFVELLRSLLKSPSAVVSNYPAKPKPGYVWIGTGHFAGEPELAAVWWLPSKGCLELQTPTRRRLRYFSWSELKTFAANGKVIRVYKVSKPPT